MAKLDSELTKINSNRVIFDTAYSYSVITILIAIALHFQLIWLWLFFIPLIGGEQYALQIQLHGGLHGHLFKNRKLNDTYSKLFLAYPLYMVFKGFRKKHLDHHQFLGTPQDPDRYYYEHKNKNTRLKFILFLTGIETGLRGLRSAFQKEKTPSAGMFEGIYVVLFQAALLGFLTYLGGPFAYFFLWFLPFYIGVYLCQNIRSFAEHGHIEPDDLADSRRKVSYSSSLLERHFFAPHRMNFHAEHHLYPQVPYTKLHLLELKEPFEVRRSYLGFILYFWKQLPLDLKVN